MEVVREEEVSPTKEEKEVEDFEEVLPDGTVHHTHRVRSHSFKRVRKVWKSVDGEEIEEVETQEVPGSLKEDTVEVFDEPPRVVHEEEEFDETRADGSKVHRKMVMNRMVHRVRTHQESFDSDHGRQVEDFAVDEVVPGTETCFVQGDGSSSESESEGEGESEGGAAAARAGGAAAGRGATSASGDGEDEVETHRLMLRKEVHKQTVVGPDGREHTTVREDSQIQQDNDPPEELRGSMQEIIDQFMASDPAPPALPEDQGQRSKQEDV